MIVVVLALLAIVLSWFANRFMLKIFKENAVIYGAPALEELFKTIPAYLLNRPVLYVHILFGLGEAVYDYFSGERETGKWAAAVSLLSHSVFGVVTVLLITFTGNLLFALISSICIHCGWNYFIMTQGRYKKRR